MRIIFILASILILQGCVGAIIMRHNDITLQNPIISTRKGRLSHNATTDDPITSQELLTYWGRADRIRKASSGEEIWIYNFDRRWNGLLLMSIIGIPLIVPVGHEYVVFTVDGSNIVSAHVISQGMYGAGCIYTRDDLACTFNFTSGKDNIDSSFIEDRDSNLLRTPRKKDSGER